MVVGSNRGATLHKTLVEATDRALELADAQPDDEPVLLVEIEIKQTFSLTDDVRRRGKQ
jgi:hypothetical protein